jgi:hypothetical protein
VSEFLGETAKNGCVAARRRRSRTAVAVDWPLGSGGAAASGSYQKAHYTPFLFPMLLRDAFSRLLVRLHRHGLRVNTFCPAPGPIATR